MGDYPPGAGATGPYYPHAQGTPRPETPRRHGASGHYGRADSDGNAHSKKFADHSAAQAMYLVYYNFVRINSAIKKFPAMAAGIETKLWEMTGLLAMVDAYWAAKK